MKYKNHRLLLIPFFIFSILSMTNIVCSSISREAEADVVFLKPLRVNEINFFKIILHNLDIDSSQLVMKLHHSSFEKSSFKFNINTQNSIISKNGKTVILEGYFFLPNVLPVGKGIIEVKTQNSIVYKKDLVVNPEIVFHSPMFQKGFPVYASESETGMRNLAADAYPMAQISFSNPKKKSFFFFKIQLVDGNKVTLKHEKVKLRIYIKQRILDEIIVDRVPKKYVYCLSKDFIGSIDWLKIRFETYSLKGDELTFKDTIYKYEYFSLLPYNGIPRWINHFLKDSDILENKFRCQQD